MKSLIFIVLLLALVPTAPQSSLIAPQKTRAQNPSPPQAATVVRKYRAILNQNNTFAPDAVILENTFNDDPTLYRDSKGNYRLVLAGGFFIVNQTSVKIGSGHNDDFVTDVALVDAWRIGDDEIKIVTKNLNMAGGLAKPIDGLLQETVIEIEATYF